jgi:hypothetical protein
MVVRLWVVLGVLVLVAGCGGSSTHVKAVAPVATSGVAKDAAAMSMCGHLTGMKLYARMVSTLKGSKSESKQRAGYLTEKSQETTAMKTTMKQSRVPAVRQIAASGGDPSKITAWCHANGLIP